MATDWVKIRSDLYRDSKVSVMADALLDGNGGLSRFVSHLQGNAMCVTRNVMRNAVVGGLVSVWGLARHQGKRVGDDLVLNSATASSIDDMADMEGFAAAMEAVGWLVKSTQGYTLPNFFAEYNADPNEHIKEKNRLRQQRFREKNSGENRNVTRNVTVTLHNATEKRENRDLNPTPTSPQKSGVGGVLTNLTAEDLSSREKLSAIRVSDPRWESERGGLLLLAAARRALDKGRKSPGGLFRRLLSMPDEQLAELVEPYIHEARQQLVAWRQRGASPIAAELAATLTARGDTS